MVGCGVGVNLAIINLNLFDILIDLCLISGVLSSEKQTAAKSVGSIAVNSRAIKLEPDRVGAGDRSGCTGNITGDGFGGIRSDGNAAAIARNFDDIILCPMVFLRCRIQLAVAICVPVDRTTAGKSSLCGIAMLNLHIGIRHLDIIDRAVIHGDGQLFLSIKGNQRGQQPIAVSLLRHRDQIIIRKGHIRHIGHAQGHFQLIEQLRQQNAGLTGNRKLHALIIKIHRKAGKGREAGGGEGDPAILGRRGIDIICLAVVTDVDDQHLGILVQLHAGNGHFHSNRSSKGLPVAAIVILHGNIPHEQLAGSGITLPLSQKLFNSYRSRGSTGGTGLHDRRNGHTAAHRNTADADAAPSILVEALPLRSVLTILCR